MRLPSVSDPRRKEAPPPQQHEQQSPDYLKTYSLKSLLSSPGLNVTFNVWPVIGHAQRIGPEKKLLSQTIHDVHGGRGGGQA